MNTLPVPATDLLTSLDTCDGCGARAHVLVVLANGGELLFCTHHARAHHDALQDHAVYIHDFTEDATKR